MRPSYRLSSRLAVALVGVVVLLGLVLTGSRSQAAAPLLTPRVFLPMGLRAYQSGPLPIGPFGVGDTSDTALAFQPQGMNLAVTAGISYDRVGASWSDIEPTNTTPDQYHWGDTDYLIHTLLAQGIQPYVLIYRSPSWAASTPCGPIYNPADLAEFVAALAARYPQVLYWGLYNEVDGVQYSFNGYTSGGCFGEPDLDANGVPDYQDYAELSRVAWSALHSVNPNARLSIANLAFDGFAPGLGPPDYPAGGYGFNYFFVDNLFAYMEAHPLPPGQGYGDLLGFNDYLIYNVYYWEYKYPQIGVGAKAQALREIMARHGFNLPLIITEMSARPTLPAREGVTQRVQARLLAQMYTQLLYYDIELGLWWTWDDYPENCSVDVDCSVFKFGLIDTNLTPKTAYFAYQTLIRELRGWQPDTLRDKKEFVDFGFRRGAERKRVLYVPSDPFGPDPASVDVRFQARALRVTDMLGRIYRYEDGGTGEIVLTVGPDPLYVQVTP